MPHEISEDLLILAGYAVSEDPDRPGWFLWTRREKGQLVGACETSLPSAEAATSEVVGMIREVLEEEADLSAEDWEAMGFEERRAIILEQFG